MIITAGVIAAGVAVLYWTYSWGNVADQQYSQSVNSNSHAMQENIGFEYTIYNSANNQLTLYIINSGLSNSLSLTRLYLWNSANQLIGTYPISNVYQTSTTKLLTANTLPKGMEAYFNVTITPALKTPPETYYTIRLETGSGRNFDESFAY
jgi:hypothetical protein